MSIALKREILNIDCLWLESLHYRDNTKQIKSKYFIAHIAPELTAKSFLFL